MIERIPKATHSGILQLGNQQIEVFVLDDGRAIISEAGMVAFFKYLEGDSDATDEQINVFADFIKQPASEIKKKLKKR